MLQFIAHSIANSDSLAREIETDQSLIPALVDLRDYDGSILLTEFLLEAVCSLGQFELTSMAKTEQLAQADELIAWLSAVPLPAVVMGDLNTAPGNAWTASYGRFTDAGYADLWSLAAPADPGPTCCQSNDLQNLSSLLDRRFDLAFYRDPAPLDGIGLTDWVEAERLGATTEEKTPSNLWPSDHAGVAVALRPIPGIGGS